VNGYTGHDSLTISLTGTSDTVVIGAAGAEYIYSSSHTLLATVHLI
jgi:hypothetical protein